MATALLGDQIDIHCGGVDNIFPHHEAEIAQSEGVTGKKFVRYWMHCEHLLVDGQKMSKSLGNFYTIPDVLAKGYTGREIRYALLRVNYRKPLNFTWEGMEEARESLARIDEWTIRLEEKSQEPNTQRSTSSVEAPGERFETALDDDLNISGALGVLFDGIRDSNRALDEQTLDSGAAHKWLQWWARIDQVLAITGTRAGIPDEIVTLAEERVQARLAKDFRRSDELRDKLATLGWEVRDGKDGQKITKRAGT
jgi:cysteinyl-tRNA synthetase